MKLSKKTQEDVVAQDITRIRERIQRGEAMPEVMPAMDAINAREAQMTAHQLQGSPPRTSSSNRSGIPADEYVMRAGLTAEMIDQQRVELVKAGVEPSIAMEFMELTKTNALKPRRVN